MIVQRQHKSSYECLRLQGLLFRASQAPLPPPRCAHCCVVEANKAARARQPTTSETRERRLRQGTRHRHHTSSAAQSGVSERPEVAALTMVRRRLLLWPTARAPPKSNAAVQRAARAVFRRLSSPSFLHPLPIKCPHHCHQHHHIHLLSCCRYDLLRNESNSTPF